MAKSAVPTTAMARPTSVEKRSVTAATSPTAITKKAAGRDGLLATTGAAERAHQATSTMTGTRPGEGDAPPPPPPAAAAPAGTRAPAPGGRRPGRPAAWEG